MAGTTSRWWTKDTVAVVTGSNKGIGFEIVRSLAKQGITTVLTARDETRGRESTVKLKKEGLHVAFHPLDVTSVDSVGVFADWLQKEFGGLDILINNAGISRSEVSYANAKEVLETNYYGVKRVTQKLLPLLRPSPFGARIVNVSSRLGQFSCFTNATLVKKLGDVDHLSEDGVDSFARQYLEDVKSAVWRSKGWTTRFPQYCESKLFLNAYTRVFAKSLSSRPEGQKIYVNVICPGFISTDLTHNNKMARPTEEGADTPVWLALLPDNVPSGKQFAERREIEF